MSRIQLFQERGIPYILRLEEEWNLASQAEDSRFIHQWFDGLSKGKSQTLVLELGKTPGVTTAVTAKRLEDNSLIILAHTPEIRNSLHMYRSR